MTALRRAALLAQIRRECASALKFMDGVEREEFLSDDLKRHGVAMCLIVIGEVAARLATSDPEFIAAHPDIPWNSIVGMRNRIAHGYHELDFGLVWDTVTAFVPDLLAKLPKPES